MYGNTEESFRKLYVKGTTVSTLSGKGRGEWGITTLPCTWRQTELLNPSTTPRTLNERCGNQRKMLCTRNAPLSLHAGWLLKRGQGVTSFICSWLGIWSMRNGFIKWVSDLYLISIWTVVNPKPYLISIVSNSSCPWAANSSLVAESY